MNTPKSTGEAWDKLGEKVDSFVEALIEEKSLPGMTVAVTKGGAASGIAGLRLRSRGRNEEVADETVLAQSNRECDESCRHRPIRLPVDEVEEHRSQVTKALRSERIVRRHF